MTYKRRAVQKWQGLALLGIEGKAGATRVGARSEGGGRASKDSGDGELHVDQGKGQRKWQGKWQGQGVPDTGRNAAA